MKKHFVCILIFASLLNINNLYSQTSPFDGMGIIVVDVRDSVSNEQISGLKIYLGNEAGEVIKGGWEYISKDTSSLFFKPNLTETNPNWENEYDGYMQIRYSFAKDNYIRVFYNNLLKSGSVFLHIVDTSSVRIEKYQPKVLKLTPENGFRLRENIGVWYKLKEMKETPMLDKPFNQEINVILSKNTKN